MESIFEKRLTVTPDYCDASGALSPLAAFTIFQGIAAQHAEVLGVGSSAMAKKGEFWLTVHTRVDLFERAYLMDELTVRTWAEACSERDVRTRRPSPKNCSASMKSLRTPTFSRTTPCGRRTSTSATT